MTNQGRPSDSTASTSCHPGSMLAADNKTIRGSWHSSIKKKREDGDGDGGTIYAETNGGPSLESAAAAGMRERVEEAEARRFATAPPEPDDETPSQRFVTTPLASCMGNEPELVDAVLRLTNVLHVFVTSACKMCPSAGVFLTGHANGESQVLRRIRGLHPKGLDERSGR